MWRAIIRQTHEQLKTYIHPTNVAVEVLLEEDSNQIAQMEQKEGRSQAVDQLISKLLSLKDVRWTNSFPNALKNQHPVLFDAVTKAKETFLKEELAARTIEGKCLQYIMKHFPKQFS